MSTLRGSKDEGHWDEERKYVETLLTESDDEAGLFHTRNAVMTAAPTRTMTAFRGGIAEDEEKRERDRAETKLEEAPLAPLLRQLSIT